MSETWQEMMDRRAAALVARLRSTKTVHSPITLIYLRENLFVDTSKKDA